LARILVGHAETGADLLQARQHDVDGQRVDRHQGGGYGDELPARDGERVGRLFARLLVHDHWSCREAEMKMRRKTGA
jgi:hypothetical protein